MVKIIKNSICVLMISSLLMSLVACVSSTLEEANFNLYKAVLDGDQSAVKRIIINEGADVNSQSLFDKGRTPLIRAILENDMPMIKLLLSLGADINKGEYKNVPPLAFATGHGQVETVKFLLDNGADVDAIDDFGATPLYRTIGADVEINKKIEIIDILLEKGADINVMLNNGITVVLKAASDNDVELLKYLIEKGADPKIIPLSDDGETVIESLERVDKEEYSEVIMILKEHGLE